MRVKSRMLKGFSAVSVGIVLSAFIGMIFNPLMARFMGPEGYGEFAVLLSLFTILSYLFLFGLDKGSRKHLTQYKDQKQGIASLCLLVVILTGLIPLLLGSAILLLTYFFGFNVESNLTYLLILALPTVVASNIHYIAMSFLYAEFKEVKAEGIQVFRKLIFFSGSIILIYLGFGIEAIAFFLFVAPLITGSLGLFYYNTKVKFSLKAAIKAYNGVFRKLIRFSALVFIVSFFFNIHLYFDIVLIEIFEDSEQTGIYKAMIVVAHFIWFIPGAVSRVSLYNFSEMVSNSRQEEIQKYVKYIISKQIAFVALLGLGVIVLAEPFVEIYYGEAFLQGTNILKLLVLGSVLGTSNIIISPALEATGKIMYSVKAVSIPAIINIVVNLALIPIYGIAGAAIATTISYASLMLAYSYYYFKATGLNVLKEIKWFRIMISVLITYSILFFLRSMIDSSLTQIIVMPIAGAIFYGILSLRLGLCTSEEIENVVADLPGYKPRMLSKVFFILRKLEP